MTITIILNLHTGSSGCNNGNGNDTGKVNSDPDIITMSKKNSDNHSIDNDDEFKINDNDSSNCICDRNTKFISHESRWYSDTKISNNNNNNNNNNDNNDVGKNDELSEFKIDDSHFKLHTIINEKARIIPFFINSFYTNIFKHF